MAQYIYGRNTVLSALKEHKVKAIYIADGFSLFSILNEIKKQNIIAKTSSKQDLNRMAQNGNHQGVVAEIEDYKYASLEEIIKKSKKISIFINCYS